MYADRSLHLLAFVRLQEGIVIAFGRMAIVRKGYKYEEKREVLDLWSRLPTDDKVVLMGCVSCVLRMKVSREFIQAWLECWKNDAGCALNDVNTSYRPLLDRELTTSSPNLLIWPTENEKSLGPRFFQVLSQAVIESVVCHVFAEVLMEAVYKRLSRAPKMLTCYSSVGQSQEWIVQSEMLLGRWTLPEDEEMDEDFEAALMNCKDSEDIEKEVEEEEEEEEDEEEEEEEEEDDGQCRNPFQVFSYIIYVFRRSVDHFERLLFSW